MAQTLEARSRAAATYWIIFYCSDNYPQISKYTIDIKITNPKTANTVATCNSRFA